MRGQEEFGCSWCRMRYWARSVLRIPFRYCEQCKGKMRLAQHAWRTWGNAVTREPR